MIQQMPRALRALAYLLFWVFVVLVTGSAGAALMYGVWLVLGKTMYYALFGGGILVFVYVMIYRELE